MMHRVIEIQYEAVKSRRVDEGHLLHPSLEVSVFGIASMEGNYDPVVSHSSLVQDYLKSRILESQ
jgi:hypothetical protein